MFFTPIDTFGFSTKPPSPYKLMDGMVYVLFLEGAAAAVDERLLIECANSYSQHLGHVIQYAQFIYGTIASFDPKYMDPSDNYAVIGRTSSEVWDYFRMKKLEAKLLSNFFEKNDEQRHLHTFYPRPDGTVLGEASSIGQVVGLSVHIAEGRVRDLRLTAENRYGSGRDKEMLYVPKVEELLALAMIHEVGHNRTSHTHPATIHQGTDDDMGLMSAKLLHPDGFEATLNDIGNLKFLERFNKAMHNTPPKYHGPYQYPENHDCYRAPTDNYLWNRGS